MGNFFKCEEFESNITNNISTNYKLHLHENLCICAIEEGSVEFEHRLGNFVLSPGKIAVFDAFLPHRLIKHKGVREYYILHIYKEYWIDKNVIDNKRWWREFLNSSKKIERSTLEDFIEKFIKSFSKKDSYNISTNRLKEIKALVDKNIHKDISLKSIADNFKLNSSYLSRAFKKEFGLPLSRYMLNRKIHISKKMLDDGMDISMVALELGFCDQAHFYKAFKSIFSITPNEYKNIINFT